jgi:hypothetical protein
MLPLPVPRPIHRTKSLWLGLLALLGGAWIRSMAYVDGFFWLAGSFAITAGQGLGAVYFTCDVSFSSAAPMRVFQWVHDPIPPEGEPWFGRAFVWETYVGQLQLTIAWWFLILLFLLAWSSFLAWRRRRIRRLTGSPPATSDHR